MMPHSPHNPPERIARQVPRQGTHPRNRQVLGDVRVVRRDMRAVARLSRAPKNRGQYPRDLPGGQRLDPGSRSRPIRAAVEAIALRRRAQDPDPGPMAGQGRAANLRSLLRARSTSPPPSSKPQAWNPQAGLQGVNLLDDEGRLRPTAPSSARSSLTTRWTSTTPPRASATAGSSPATGS